MQKRAHTDIFNIAKFEFVFHGRFVLFVYIIATPFPMCKNLSVQILDKSALLLDRFSCLAYTGK